MGYQAGGYGAGSANSFSNSVIIGSLAGYNITTGGYNVLLGYAAGENLTTGAKNIVIGYDIDAPAVDSTNTLNIGNLIYATGLDGANGTLSSGNVGIGTTTPTAKLHVDQSSTTAAIPVLTLDQADVSEEFIHFIGTAANEVLTQSLFKEDPAFSYFTIQGYIKVYVEDIGNQITDGVYYIPFGTNAAVP